jgi:hypothetical protein
MSESMAIVIEKPLLMSWDSYLRNGGGTDRRFIFIPTRWSSFRLPAFFESFSYFSCFPDGIFLLLLNLLKAK